jgi:hypothetical protein
MLRLPAAQQALAAAGIGAMQQVTRRGLIGKQFTGPEPRRRQQPALIVRSSGMGHRPVGHSDRRRYHSALAWPAS